MPVVRLFWACLVCLAVAMAGVSWASQKRVALVIGNSEYANVPILRNPKQDAQAIGKLLTSIGFDTEVYYDLRRADFEATLSDFSDKANGADMVIIYYAGHGMEVDQKNYLVPIDAELLSARRVRFEAISLENVISALDGANGLRMVLLDACRTNPFLAAMKSNSGKSRSIERGFAPIEAAEGMVVSYSAREGSVADDGGGDHSPFAQALLNHLGQPGLELQFVLRKVRDDVRRLTNNNQEPYLSASLPGDPIYLVPAATAETNAPQLGAPNMQTDFSLTAAINTAEAWQIFLDQYGNLTDNLYVRLAHSALNKLQSTEKMGQIDVPATKAQTTSRTSADTSGSGTSAHAPANTVAPLRATAAGANTKTIGSKVAEQPQGVKVAGQKSPAKPSVNPKDSVRSIASTSKSPVQQDSAASATDQPVQPVVIPIPKPKRTAPVASSATATLPAAPAGRRPEARVYSYSIWKPGGLRSNLVETRSTPYGLLSCLESGGGKKHSEPNMRVCRWID